MTDNDQTTPDSSNGSISSERTTPAEPEGPSSEPPPPAAAQVAGPPNGDGETALAIALEDRRRLLDFLEEMRHEQAVERGQWFALIERLSTDQDARQWWPLRIWHWLIADASVPAPSLISGERRQRTRHSDA